jgi:hypothetical protein
MVLSGNDFAQNYSSRQSGYEHGASNQLSDWKGCDDLVTITNDAELVS